ncbi:MAG: hypothetical protein ACXVEE_31075 [Polyangiales bacterium]
MKRALAGSFVLAGLLSPFALTSRAAPPVPPPAASASSSTPSAPAASAAPATGAPSVLADPGYKVKGYQEALGAAKLGGPSAPYSPEEVRDIVAAQQEAMIAGRLSEVVSVLTAVVESKRFELVSREPEGRAAYRLLGEALAREGVHSLARVYLRKAAAGPYKEATSRSATRRLTDLALEDEAYGQGISDLAPILKGAPDSQELRGELDYLVGRQAESEGDVEGAMKAYSAIVPLSRFWSAATYRRGVLEVDKGHMQEAEKLFCQVADPKRQDDSAPVFADERFFAVRDLARLALGRLAHEGKRHDDARYYYYLVPQDSKRLAEALYESATTRYEAGDYDGARDLLDELATLGEGHVYDDEYRVLDAYVDIAQCKFDDASKKLEAFLEIYSPVRDRAHALAKGPDADIRVFLERGDRSTAAGTSNAKGVALETDAKIWRRLEADPALLVVLRARRRLAAQLAGLGAAEKQLDGLADTLGGGKTKAAIDPTKIGATDEEKAAEIREALDAIRKEIALLKKNGGSATEIAKLEADVQALTDKAAAMESPAGVPTDQELAKGAGLPGMVSADAKQAKFLGAQGKVILAELDAAAIALTRDALLRLDKRTARLVARARLAKIDVVLGRKKGLENEVDAIRQGILPKGAIDSLDAERYLQDNEEYWPFEGDEWLDEVIGVEQGER